MKSNYAIQESEDDFVKIRLSCVLLQEEGVDVMNRETAHER